MYACMHNELSFCCLHSLQTLIVGGSFALKEFTDIKIKRRDEKTFMVGLIKDTIVLFIRSVQNADCRLQTADRVQNAD